MHYQVNRSLVVHPLNECNIWRSRDAETARRAMAPAAAPDERVLVLVPCDLRVVGVHTAPTARKVQ